MRATSDFRWLDLPRDGLVGLAHPTAFSPYQDAPTFRVLQQRWSSDYVGEPDEWRDIAVVNTP